MASPVTHATPQDRSIVQLLHDLSDGTAQLVRQEIRLARTETFESVLGLKRGSVWVGGGVGLALAGSGALVAFLILAIAQAVGGRTWLAALIVAVVLSLAGWLCLKHGMSALSATRLTPHETATSIKETAEWLKHPTKSAAS
ncbi:MAG: phage holin family protein [Gemmatimonadaceae bacterium]